MQMTLFKENKKEFKDLKLKNDNGIKTYVIDLFCGAGGTSTAIHESNTNISVIACINHDKNAIRSHKENYPNCVHYTEDIRTIDISPVINYVKNIRKKNPLCKIAIWASLECTNFSNAKGGQARDADSRSLADHLFRYLDFINPDFLWIENVREFMSWGPLDKNGKPVDKYKGEDYERWVNKIKDYGYSYEWKLLNSANHGGRTIRTRYFSQFSKEKSLISFPDPTHSKFPEKTGLKKWLPVKDVLDLNNEGNSIFKRKKELSENTLKRILAGLIKFVSKGDENFIKKYYSERPKGKVISVDGPCGTITTVNNHALVKCIFLSSYYGHGSIIDVDEPCHTVTTKDRFAKIDINFLKTYNSGNDKERVKSLEDPAGSITTSNTHAKININFIDEQYGNGSSKDIDLPSGSITNIPKQNLVTVKPWLINMNSSTSPSRDLEKPSPTVTQRTHRLITTEINDKFLMNPQWGNSNHSLNKPCFTLIARMDKAPPYVISTKNGVSGVIVYESDSNTMVEIKKFMAMYDISDIKMRMLEIPELLGIQGFPENYILKGTKTEQKKYIGNSVEVKVGVALFKSIDEKIQLSK